MAQWLECRSLTGELFPMSDIWLTCDHFVCKVSTIGTTKYQPDTPLDHLRVNRQPTQEQ